jgi:predicted branched-subunit amino acid permease
MAKGSIILTYETHRRDIAAGMHFVAPWLIGMVPFGLVIGVSAVKADISTFVGWLTGPVIYGSAAQLATIEMLDAGAGVVAVVATTAVINLRLLLYSAVMATYWRGTPLWYRLVAGYLLVDPSFVAGIERYGREPDRLKGHAHYLGAAVAVWLTWLVSITVGATVGGRMPDSLHLEFLFPLFLIGEIVPKLRSAAVRRAVFVGGTASLACITAPMRLSIVIGIAAGMIAGMVGRPNTSGSTVEDQS